MGDSPGAELAEFGHVLGGRNAKPRGYAHLCQHLRHDASPPDPPGRNGQLSFETVGIAGLRQEHSRFLGVIRITSEGGIRIV